MLTLPTTGGGGGAQIFFHRAKNLATPACLSVFVGGHRQIPVFSELWKVKKIRN